jgi:hypothetical protein
MPTWFWIFLLLAGSLFGLKLLYIAATAAVLPMTQGALYVSTARVRIEAVFDAVKLSPDQLLIDLGCGDARVLRSACRRYGVRAVGYEINLLAFLKAVFLCLFYPGIRLKLADFWQADISKADVIFCYLYPDVLERLRAKLAEELKPGATVVSGNFPLPGWTPDDVISCEQPLYNSPLYIYRTFRSKGPGSRQWGDDKRDSFTGSGC